jgi:dihydrofolate reductase
MISMIVAVGPKFEIGLKGQMPWHIKADFAHFKKTTMGHTLIMGRKTFESIGRPLPGRKTFILTRDSSYQQQDCETFQSLEAALEMAMQSGEDEVFIAGGGEIYKQALGLCDRIYLSQVDYHGEADAFFPTLLEQEWCDRVEGVDYPAVGKSPAWRMRVLERASSL